jgi:hypothetical protein
VEPVGEGVVVAGGMMDGGDGGSKGVGDSFGGERGVRGK